MLLCWTQRLRFDNGGSLDLGSARLSRRGKLRDINGRTGRNIVDREDRIVFFVPERLGRLIGREIEEASHILE
jgi:hypothetical protein